MILAFGFCNVAILPLRSEPSHTAEQVTQLLFGERAEILEIDTNGWARIRCEWDGYEGWGKASQMGTVQRKEYRKEAKFMAGKLTDKLVFEHSEMWLPVGSDLFGIKRGRIAIGADAGKFKGKRINIKKLSIDQEGVKAAAMHYIHAPYQWGGRTIAGIDCSGLTQMAYKLCGKPLLRDASQQAQDGELVDFLQNAHCGDLAFFDNAEGKIVHVGILLDNQTIIHATDYAGRVVIDRIDPGGIISTSLRKRTHNLRVVKRYF